MFEGGVFFTSAFLAGGVLAGVVLVPALLGCFTVLLTVALTTTLAGVLAVPLVLGDTFALAAVTT